MGVFEIEEFSKGSLCLLESVTNSKGLSIVGGGDTLNLLKKVKNCKEKISHVSTGGGASLELLEGKILPGVDHLTDID
jgi:3-phosphoglycerate kinase